MKPLVCPYCKQAQWGPMAEHMAGCPKRPQEVVPQVKKGSSTKQQRWQAKNPDAVRASKRDYMRRRRAASSQAQVKTLALKGAALYRPLGARKGPCPSPRPAQARIEADAKGAAPLGGKRRAS